MILNPQSRTKRASASWQEKGFENEIFVMLTPMALRVVSLLWRIRSLSDQSGYEAVAAIGGVSR
jgi:hypothetical protein